MADETLLQEAIESLRRGDRALARDQLTELLKTDQNNAEIWVWMSAAVDTAKERIYCLQTALRIDPENAAAKRGLVLLGAQPPDEDAAPFPLNRRRAWGEDLVLDPEAEVKPRGLKARLATPGGRLAGILVVAAALITVGYFALFSPRSGFRAARPYTPGPSPTFTGTPTVFGGPARTSTPTFTGATPLWALLDATYTPTAQYITTLRAPESGDVFSAAKRAFNNNDMATYINLMQQIATLEPNSADPHFFIGEAYRMQGEYLLALAAYDRAIAINPNFGPAFVGRARVRLALDPAENVLSDLDRAVSLSPDYLDAHLERAAFLLSQGEIEAALADLEAARAINSESPLLYVYQAKIDLALGRPVDALEAAQKAHDMDITLLPAYLVLGQAFAANGMTDDAVGALQTYALYYPEDRSTYLILATAYNQAGEYERALALAQAILEDDQFNGQAWLVRGGAYLGLGDGPNAEYDFKTAENFYPNSFAACLGVARARYIQPDLVPSAAFYKLRECLPKVANDGEMALYHYWMALFQENMNRMSDAAVSWRALLDLPEGAATPAMLEEARTHLEALGQ